MAKNRLRRYNMAPELIPREAFLHYVWKFKLFELNNLMSVHNTAIELLGTGAHNHESGPDFFNASIRIDGQFWFGNVEIHVKASDWYVHRHEEDANYIGVILHVVWEYDVPVFRKDGSEICCLELKNYVHTSALLSYRKIFSGGQRWILCEKHIMEVELVIVKNWLQRLYFERLKRKTEEILMMLAETTNDWEGVLFRMLAKGYGMKLNGSAFLNLSQSIDFSILRKLRSSPGGLESLFFGQAGFLIEEKEDIYYTALRTEYNYYARKFQLEPLFHSQFQFFRLRPANFPSIRISQLASLYESRTNLFSSLMSITKVEDYYALLKVPAASYWDTHYVFGRTSKKRQKIVSKRFMDTLLINAIIPLKYAYMSSNKLLGTDDLENSMLSVKAEKNAVIEHFKALGVSAENALESQALLEMKTNYCDKKKCLNCALGLQLMKHI